MDISGAQHAREAENSYPAIYKVQLWVRICVVGLAVVPVSLLFAAISGAIHTKSDGLAYSLIALFAALAVYGVAWAFTAQVTICADRFEQRKPFVHRVLLVAEIAGRRYAKGPGAFYPVIVPKGGRSFSLDKYAYGLDDRFDSWFRGLRDLN
ncbi:hypothetical protein [Dyella sp. ASV21]|uniref:hypothetical protein n=1 Tax=Dyella sp. ASV21 TaxID=2795114 RepID=UPI0018ED7EF9|nr:hypothetical protein [Dyella sp. ASV21]